MKSREYIILGIVIVLLGAYLLIRSGDRSQYDLPDLPDLAGDEVSKIEIANGDETVLLVRSDDQWLIGENRYPADTASVEDIIEVLQDLTLTALVSEAGAYARYDLTDDTEIVVRAWTEDRLVRNLAVGKAADTYQHTFVRIGVFPGVYHARDNFRRTFDLTPEDLRDKTALSFDVSDITAIDIAFGEKSLSLSLEEAPVETTDAGDADTKPASQAESVWMKNGTPADGDTVQRLLSQLAYLNCSGYPDGVTGESLGAPTRTITLKGKEDYFISLFETETSQTDCTGISSQNEYPFTLGETAYSRLSETMAQLLEIEEGT